MSATDPLATVWAALEARDCGPHGASHDFRARCPAHEGDSLDALHVREGADRRVVLWCFAHGCDATQITAAVGLTVADLFPAGHRGARRRSIEPVRRSDLTGNAQLVANLLGALDQLDQRWATSITLDCSYCGALHALLRAESNGVAFLHCSTGCTIETMAQTLAGLLHDRSEAAS